MKLDNNFTLENDSNCWTLKYEKETDRINAKTGKAIIESNQWYFADIKQSLKWYCDKAVKPCNNAEEILLKLADLHRLIIDNFCQTSKK